MKPDKPLGFWSLRPLANLSDDEFAELVAEISAQIVESLNDPAAKAPEEAMAEHLRHRPECGDRRLGPSGVTV